MLGEAREPSDTRCLSLSKAPDTKSFNQKNHIAQTNSLIVFRSSFFECEWKRKPFIVSPLRGSDFMDVHVLQSFHLLQ